MLLLDKCAGDLVDADHVWLEGSDDTTTDFGMAPRVERFADLSGGEVSILV